MNIICMQKRLWHDFQHFVDGHGLTEEYPDPVPCDSSKVCRAQKAHKRLAAQMN